MLVFTEFSNSIVQMFVLPSSAIMAVMICSHHQMMLLLTWSKLAHYLSHRGEGHHSDPPHHPLLSHSETTKHPAQPSHAATNPPAPGQVQGPGFTPATPTAQTQDIRSLLPGARVTLGSIFMDQQTRLVCWSLDLGMKHHYMLQVSKS